MERIGSLVPIAIGIVSFASLPAGGRKAKEKQIKISSFNNLCFCYGKSTKTISPNKAIPPLLNNTANPGKVVDWHPNIPDEERRDAFAGFAGMVQFTTTLPAPGNIAGTGCLGGPTRG